MRDYLWPVVLLLGETVALTLARGLPAGTATERFPAKDMCSRCGLCETSLIAKVQERCAFLGDGQSRLTEMERTVHGRERDQSDDDELYFGVGALTYAKMKQRPKKAAWTGIVTSLAAAALEAGIVDAVVGVGSKGSGPLDRMTASPVVCRTAKEVFEQCAGVKPTLSPSLNVMDAVRDDPSIRTLLFLGVGCQVQALRSVPVAELGLDELFVVGTNCADNVRSPEALERFMSAVSASPETAVGFEFMQDYKIHVKHVTPLYEKVPVFTLPSEDLKDVIAESCYSCFDYVNALADVTVGYMATPDEGVEMTEHSQYLVVRNERGQRLLDLLEGKIELAPAVTSGKRFEFAMQVTEQDLTTLFLGAKPKIWALPTWVANLAAKFLGIVGPSGLEFAKNSIDYHQLRNAINVRVKRGDSRAEQHIPSYAKKIEADYYDGFTDDLVQRYRTGLGSSGDSDSAPETRDVYQ